MLKKNLKQLNEEIKWSWTNPWNDVNDKFKHKIVICQVRKKNPQSHHDNDNIIKERRVARVRRKKNNARVYNKIQVISCFKFMIKSNLIFFPLDFIHLFMNTFVIWILPRFERCIWAYIFFFCQFMLLTKVEIEIEIITFFEGQHYYHHHHHNHDHYSLTITLVAEQRHRQTKWKSLSFCFLFLLY